MSVNGARRSGRSRACARRSSRQRADGESEVPPESGDPDGAGLPGRGPRRRLCRRAASDRPWRSGAYRDRGDSKTNNLSRAAPIHNLFGRRPSRSGKTAPVRAWWVDAFAQVKPQPAISTPRLGCAEECLSGGDASDLPLLFGTEAAWKAAALLTSASWDEVDRAGRELRRIWADFARSGRAPSMDIPGLIHIR
jgi:hypothetical protein